MKFEINEKVIHYREGLSIIVGTTTMNNRKYYLVKAVHAKDETIYVPFETAEQMVRAIMSIDESNKVIEYMRTVKPEFISNTKQRRDIYKKRLGSGNVYDLAYLACQLFLFKYLNEHGTVVKLGPTDIEMLEYARNVLFDEFSLSFGKPLEIIKSLVESRML